MVLILCLNKVNSLLLLTGHLEPKVSIFASLWKHEECCGRWISTIYTGET